MQRITSQILEKTCDGCGAVKVYDLVQLTEASVAELESWRTLVREVYMDRGDGQGPAFHKIMYQSCSQPCTTICDVNFETKKKAARERAGQAEAAADDRIDLASLKQN